MDGWWLASGLESSGGGVITSTRRSAGLQHVAVVYFVRVCVRLQGRWWWMASTLVVDGIQRTEAKRPAAGKLPAAEPQLAAVGTTSPSGYLS